MYIYDIQCVNDYRQIANIGTRMFRSINKVQQQSSQYFISFCIADIVVDIINWLDQQQHCLLSTKNIR